MIARSLAFLLRTQTALGSRWRNLLYRMLGCDLQGYVWMRRIKIPRQWPDIRIEGGVALDEGVTLLASGAPSPGKITIEREVYINQNTFIDASCSIIIGAQTMIGPNSYITDHDHQFGPEQAPGAAPLQSKPTRIGQRAWLGAGVCVMKGITIGDGAVVGAGSVVTRDIPAASLAVGSPARVIRQWGSA